MTSTTPRVLALVGEEDGCALWRVLLPFSELQRRGYKSAEWGFKDDDRLANIAHRFDAVILPRLQWPRAEWVKGDRWVEALHNAGLAIIYEIDDDLLSDHFVNRLVKTHGKSYDAAKESRDSTLRILQQVDGVTVSSQRLATLTRQHTDAPVKVVPNYIDLEWFDRVQQGAKKQVDGLTIGWAGGIRPDQDVENMARAWGRIAYKYPYVTFVIQGYVPEVITKHVPASRIRHLKWMPIHTYPAGLVNIDIGCCPLSDTPFNRAKTYIKALEYAATGAPVVASPTVYGKLLENEWDGFVVETVDEWESALSALVEDSTLRYRMAKELRKKVKKEHNLSENVWRWVDAWDQIMQDFRKKQRMKILLPAGVSRYANASSK